MGASEIFLVVVAAVAIGIVGFFAMLVVLVVRGVAHVFRALLGMGSASRPAALPRDDERRSVCPHSRCGHLNRRGAKFCGRCGRPLDRTYAVDAYG